VSRKDRAVNKHVDQSFLDHRYGRIADKYPKQKWIVFCEEMLRQGYDVFLYEATQTVSKYITVKKSRRIFKVRFSDHKPIKHRESSGDCDFFVGRTNISVTTTDQAIQAVIEFMETPHNKPLNPTPNSAPVEGGASLESEQVE
jgi:hypothetical protein